jgi:DNA polymerase III alpha subunit
LACVRRGPAKARSTPCSNKWANGYDIAFAERCFKQISDFGEYGFLKSHAPSFAKLVYVSS